MIKLKQQILFFLLIPLHVTAMELPKTVVKQGKEFVFYKGTSERKEVGRLSPSQYSIENIYMLMNLKALPHDIQHRIAFFLLGKTINSYAAFKLSKSFMGNIIARSPDGNIIMGPLGGLIPDNSSLGFFNGTSGDLITTLKKYFLLGKEGFLMFPLTAFSADSTLIFLGLEGAYGLWNTTSGEQMCKLQGHTGPITSVAFSPDDTTLLTGSADSTACLWDTKTGQQLHTLEGHTGSITSVAFSPDGKTILTTSSDNGARLWDLTGNLLAISPQEVTIWTVAFTADSSIILVTSLYDRANVSSGERVHLWNTQTGVLKELEGEAMRTGGKIVPSLDGTIIFTVVNDSSLYLWNIQTAQLLHVLQGHAKKITIATFSPNSKTIVTGSDDCTACVWDPVSGEQICSFQQHTRPLASLVYSADSRTIITCSKDSTARIWDALTGEQRCILEHTGPVISVTCSPDSNTILTGSYIPGSGDFIERLWDGVTGEQLRELSIVTELEKSLSWKEKVLFTIAKKATEFLARQGLLSHTSSLELSADGTAAFTSWAVGPNGSVPMLHLVQLWNDGYSKDFMNWVTTEIKP
ncbi:WD40 repeat domain-containing protein, partial [Candidatus Dependentiae bacterium]|nr:WD40 repeat domain-containing protein [Candidatus Dependentiae bacterium]